MNVLSITPIDKSQKQLVIARTHELIAQAAFLFDIQLPVIPVHFDLKGRIAGMYRVKQQQKEIRYNPWIFSRYFDDNLANTVPHEVAHYVVHTTFPDRRVKPHGTEWQLTMKSLGYAPTVTCGYDFAGLPGRQVKRYDYRCGCQSHRLTSYRHLRVQRRSAEYRCRQCGEALTEGPPVG